MQLPFDLSDVRMVAIDGGRIRFVLASGHVEITFDSREEATRALASRRPHRGEAAPTHVMFEDGIYGI